MHAGKPTLNQEQNQSKISTESHAEPETQTTPPLHTKTKNIQKHRQQASSTRAMYAQATKAMSLIETHLEYIRDNT
jgi:hypothetical protein